MTTKFTRLDEGCGSGTSLQGYYTTTYDQLVAAFGEPDGPSDKVTAEWVLSIRGQVVTIYDYKEGRTPKGKYDWHVGGKSRKAVEALDSLILSAGLDGHCRSGGW
jgi:hypothetical protein